MSDDKVIDSGEDVEMNKAMEMPLDTSKDVGSSNKKWWIIGGVAIFGLVILVLAVALPLALITPASMTSTGGSITTIETSSTVYTSTDGPFNVSLGLFNEGITRGYDSEAELKDDLANAAYFLLNQAVKRNAGVKGYESVGFGFGQQILTIGAPTDEAAQSDGAVNKGVGNNLNDFGTNNQESGVEEGDLIVSDGTLVYAAYGDYISIWNGRTGAQVANVQMPAIEQQQMPPWMGIEGDGKIAADSYYYNPKPMIQSLLLVGDRLLVTVNGYGPMLQAKYQNETGNTTILYDYLATHLRLYSTANIASGELDLVGTDDVNGWFQGVRAIGNYAHVMTISSINTYNDLVGPVELYNVNPDGTMTDAEYLAKVTGAATETLVPNFVEKLTNELKMSNNGVLPSLTKICVWTEETSGTGAEELAFSEGMLSSLTQISSIDMTSDVENLVAFSSATITPSSWAQVYGATNALIVAGQGWTFDAATGASSDATYLIGYSVDGASTMAHSVGKLDGSVLNSHSIDVVGDLLRVAVTVRNNTWWLIDPIPLDEPIASDGGASGSATTTATDLPESWTENYVIILQMPGMNGAEAGTMTELGRVKLGMPNEVFTAVRFFDDISYAVTFELKDPLYVLDLSDPSDPSVIGELNITGFSSYLHPMNADNTLLLAIGQEADNNGTILGLSITVFDATDPANPFASARYVIPQDANEYSYSSSLYDFKATRFAGERLIIPIDSWDGVTGAGHHRFSTFKVNATHIIPECEISYEDEQLSGDYCYYCAFLPQRSMIFDGNLMTMKDHFVRSTDMDTCSQNWALDIVVTMDNSTDYCCGRFWW